MSSDGDLFTVFQTNRARSPIRVIENDGDASLGNASLTPLVNEILLILCTHLGCNVSKFSPIEADVLTEVMFVIPSTKHIASRILDFPDPLRPVMALNEESHPVICVRTGYDLKPINVFNNVTLDKYDCYTFENQFFYPHR